MLFRRLLLLADVKDHGLRNNRCEFTARSVHLSSCPAMQNHTVDTLLCRCENECNAQPSGDCEPRVPFGMYVSADGEMMYSAEPPNT